MGFLRFLLKRPPSSAHFGFLRGFFSVYAASMSYQAFMCGVHDDMVRFDLNALVAGIYCFLALTAHSRVKKSRRRRPLD